MYQQFQSAPYKDLFLEKVFPLVLIYKYVIRLGKFKCIIYVHVDDYTG